MATYTIRPMSLGEILDGAFAIYRARFVTFVSIAVVCQGIPVLLNTYVIVGGGFFFHPLAGLLAAVLGAFAGLVSGAATVWVISEAYLGRETVVGDALGYAVKKMVRLFIAGLAKYLLIMLSAILLFFPALIVASGYAVVTQVVVLEDLDAATDALGRSWRLTKGHKWKAFFLGFLLLIFLYIPFVALGATGVIIPALFEISQIGGQLLSLILYPIVACTFTLLYYDLRVRKEAFEIEHLAAQLDTGSAPEAV